MTANELLAKQIDDVSFQLETILGGLTEDDIDFKVSPTTMSVREQIEHLCEVYTAVIEKSEGIDHQWGSYKIEDKSLYNLRTQFDTLRSKAVDIVKASNDKEVLESASDFIVSHDNYHVGQMVAIRLAMDANWDAYSIYKS